MDPIDPRGYVLQALTLAGASYHQLPERTLKLMIDQIHQATSYQEVEGVAWFLFGILSYELANRSTFKLGLPKLEDIDQKMNVLRPGLTEEDIELIYLAPTSKETLEKIGV